MFYNEHAPPHFHAAYGEFEASFRIDSLDVMGGRLPGRAQRLVLEWALLHRVELLENWQLARSGARLSRIEGLE
jgi:hypothetical protein